jgi:hypothetical protein
MNGDPIVEELHRHREELLRECGNDPEILVRYLQEKERNSDRPTQLPPPRSPSLPALEASIEQARGELSRGEARRGSVDDLMSEIGE